MRTKLYYISLFYTIKFVLKYRVVVVSIMVKMNLIIAPETC